MIAEPFTSLTDYAIALECFLFAGLMARLKQTEWLWATAFGSVGVAALLGGTYHGFAESLPWTGRVFLWQGMLLALAIASFLTVVAAAWKTGHFWRFGLLALATAKLMLSLFLEVGVWIFALRVADYLSALGIVLLLQLGRSLQQKRSQTALQDSATGLTWMTSGIAISGVAACVLILPWPTALQISPLAGYHLVQMVALYCIYRSARAIALSWSSVVCRRTTSME